MVHFSQTVFQQLLSRVHPDAIFLLVDKKVSVTVAKIQSVIEGEKAKTSEEKGQSTLKEAEIHYHTLELHAGEEIKSLSHIERVASWLNDNHATRSSLIVAIGGGALLDFAGFLAAIYKRGIAIAYLPTTLLAMIDAAYGGKTAVDILGIKNLLGVIRQPNAVFIYEDFLATLPAKERLSGFGELLKYGLLEGNPLWSDILKVDPLGDLSEITPFIEKAINIKQRYIALDLNDNGVRRHLNLGHTIGHAFEAFSSTAEAPRSLSHGEAVALAMICELYISHCRFQFPSEELHRLESFVREHIATFPLQCSNYTTLLKLIQQDKKNQGKEIKMILLKSLGKAEECSISQEELLASLDYYRDLFGY